MNAPSLALSLHVIGVVVWVSGLFTVIRFLHARSAMPDEALAMRLGQLARKEARTADVGFTLALAGGLWRLLESPSYYLQQPWMHIKLTLAVALVGIHVLVRIGAKRASRGGSTKSAALTALVLIVVVSTVAVAVLKPLAH